MTSDFIEKRSERRTIIDQYYSVEFSIIGAVFTYQFKIWNISSKGTCVVIREDSDILKRLKVGDILNMKYYQADTSKPTEYLRTKIKHITRESEGQFKGHYLVGLSIIKGQGYCQ